MKLNARTRRLEVRIAAQIVANQPPLFTLEDVFQFDRGMLRFYDMGPGSFALECRLFEEMLKAFQMTEQEFRQSVAERTTIFDPENTYETDWSPLVGFNEAARERMMRWSV